MQIWIPQGLIQIFFNLRLLYKKLKKSMNIGIINQVLINSYKFNSKHNLTKNPSQKEKKELFSPPIS